jgi:methylmalonyl-CoA/ethylmalonyl-CoA epimerase
MKFHHIGIASTDINKARESIKKLHDVVDDSGIVFDELQNASLCLLTLQDGTRLEIVAGPAVESYCKKNMTYYHICYEV